MHSSNLRAFLDRLIDGLLPLLSLTVLLALTAGCDAPMSTATISGSDNAAIWGPYTLIMWLAAIVFVVIMLLTVAYHRCARRKQGAYAVERCFRLALLKKADDRVDDHRHQQYGGVDPVAQERGDEGRGEHDVQ